MALKDFKTLQAKDFVVNKLQDNIRDFVRQLNYTILGGNLIEKTGSPDNLQDVTIGTSTTLVPHGLGRTFQGWQVTDIQADARVWRDTTSTADLTKFLPLKASASVTVKLWVY